MQIGSIVVGAVIALIAGVGSVSADEITVADTTDDTQMSDQELAAMRDAGWDCFRQYY